MSEIFKYPRTQHIEGSGIQRGDEDLTRRSAHEDFLVVVAELCGPEHPHGLLRARHDCHGVGSNPQRHEQLEEHDAKQQ